MCVICLRYQDLVSLNKNFQDGKNTSISIGDYFEEFINDEVKSGRYSFVSEAIGSALRLLEQEETCQLIRIKLNFANGFHR